MQTSVPRQVGMSLIEVVIAILTISILVTAFVPVFSIATEGSVSSQQRVTMENLAASSLDQVISGFYAAACTNPPNVTLAGTTYSINITCTSNSPMVGGKHVVVDVACSGCASISLVGDAYDIW